MKEDVDIKFRKNEIDENVENKNNIRDIDITLQTDEEGFAEIITSQINGFLLTIMARTEKREEIFKVQYNIQISMVDFPIFLFDESGIDKEGIFVPIKVDYYNVNTEDFKGQADFWALNDKLRVQVSGMKYLTVHIKLRYKQW